MIKLTAELYPFILVSYQGKSCTDDEIRAMFDRMNELSRRAITDKTHYVIISLGGTSLNAANRKLIAELVNECPKEYFDRTIGSFVIVPSAVLRGMMTALRWVAPALATVESVSSLEEAVEAGVACLEKHRIAIDRGIVTEARLWLRHEHQRSKLDAPDSAR